MLGHRVTHTKATEGRTATGLGARRVLFERRFAGRALALAAALLLAAACAPEVEVADAGGTSIEVLTRGLHAAHVARVTVTVSGPGISPAIVQNLTATKTKSDTRWTGLVRNIPAGARRKFYAAAYDRSGVLIFAGEVTDVVVLSGKTVQVWLLLQPKRPAKPFKNTVPVINALVASPTTVAPGGKSTLTVRARDADGDALTYEWRATGGLFDDAKRRRPVWTAPRRDGTYALSVIVRDKKGGTAGASVRLTVASKTSAGHAAVTAVFNAWPSVSGLTASPGRFPAGGRTRLDLTASDADGDVLSYRWSADCAGAFDRANIQDPIWTAGLTLKVGQRCALTAIVTDARGGKTTGMLTVHIGKQGVFSYALDAKLTPKPAKYLGQPLAAVADASGKTSVFFANQVWISPASSSALTAFVARTRGVVLRTNAVPTPPARAKITLTAADKLATQVLVRVDASALDLKKFEADATKAGLAGNANISDNAGARLLALVVRERAAGVVLGPNFVAPTALLRSTREHPTTGGAFVDAFGESRFATTGSRASVTQAWQIVDDRRAFSRVRVAIIDGGFWVNTTTGRPMSALSSGLSDLPADVLQYDFVNGDYVVGNRCSDSGGDCGWHGNQSASVATGRLNNRYGVAGTGGQVADPILLDSSFTFFTIATAIRTGVAWGASVVSMSLGGGCDDLFCGEFGGLFPAMRNATSNNVIMVAAAGNGGSDLVGDVADGQPCRGDHVICVGALANDVNTAIGYSNFGSNVDIWAPTNIRAMPNGDSSGSLPSASGTSASTPFVAGIVAMMRAYNGTLTAAQIRTMLRSTAWTDSSDVKVTHYVNAARALRAAMGPYSTAPEATVSLVLGGTTADLNRDFGVRAIPFDLEDGSPCCSVRWTPTPRATFNSGRNATFRYTSIGLEAITATVTDSSGKSGTGSFAVTVVNTPPVPRIAQPINLGPGTPFYVGQSIQLRGSATDKNEGAGPGAGALACSRLKWTAETVSTPAATIATGCSGTVRFTTAGTRIVRLVATDPQAASASAAVTVHVRTAPTNLPPTLTLGALPAPNYSGGYKATVPIALSASAVDPEGDNPITYRWEARVGPLGGGAPTTSTTIGTSRTLNWRPSSARGLVTNCALPGAYNGQRVQIRVTATDSGGRHRVRAFAEIKVFSCLLI